MAVIVGRGSASAVTTAAVQNSEVRRLASHHTGFLAVVTDYHVSVCSKSTGDVAFQSVCIGLFIGLMRVKKVCKNEPGCIVVAGRSNYSKASSSLEMLLADLQAAGYAVVWFEPRITQIARWKDARLARILRGRFLVWCQSNGGLGRQVRRFVTGLTLLMRPDKWIYFSQRWSSPNALAAKDLRQFLQQWPEQSVHLFAHSAGGIVSSLVADEPAVASVLCFGYPFKHPEKDEEPIRTAHLAAVCKPLLMLQGDQDAYGTALDAQRYPLSASTVVMAVDADHEYDRLAPQVYQRCLELLLGFLPPIRSD